MSEQHKGVGNMNRLRRTGLAVLLLIVAGAFAVQAEQYKGDKYHGQIQSTMANMLVLLPPRTGSPSKSPPRITP